MAIDTKSLGMYKVDSEIGGSTVVREIVERLGYPVSDTYNQQIADKITVTPKFQKTRQWSASEFSAVKFYFCHAANEYQKIHRTVNIKDGAIDLDKVQSKIDELLKLHDECDAQLAEKKLEEQEMRDRLAQLLEECNSLGVQGRDRFGVVQVDRTIESLGVSLKIQGLTPDQARAIVRLLADNT